MLSHEQYKHSELSNRFTPFSYRYRILSMLISLSMGCQFFFKFQIVNNRLEQRYLSKYKVTLKQQLLKVKLSFEEITWLLIINQEEFIKKRQKMAQKSDEFYVQVVDKNFQANIQAELGIRLDNRPQENEFIQNSDDEEYNNKPATPLNKSGYVKQSPNQNDQQSQQQAQDQEPTYKLSKVLPKHNQKQRLIEQNIKLKAQIFELAKQLDEILQKDRNRKKKFGLNVIEQQDEIIRDKKLQVKKQQLQIMQLKNKIFVAKRQLQSVYNNLVVTERQNMIKKLQGYLRQLQKQREGLLNITNGQDKVLKVVQNQEEYGEKVEKTREEYLRIKGQTRRIVVKTQEQERLLKRQHEVYIDKLQQLKEIEHKLSVNREKSKHVKKASSQSRLQTITQQMIRSLEEEVREMELRKKDGEKEWQDKIKLIDMELCRKRIQEEKKMLVLREKEKQLKLNELRIRQLRKMFRENQIAEKDKKKQDIDMSQFRHKRNIRYIEK